MRSARRPPAASSGGVAAHRSRRSSLGGRCAAVPRACTCRPAYHNAQRAGCCYFCQLGHERASSRDNAYCVLRAITRHRQRNVSDTGDGQPVRWLASCRYQDGLLKPLWNIWCQRGSRWVTGITRCRRSARCPPRRDAAPVDPSTAMRTGSSRRLGCCDWVNRSLFLHEPASRPEPPGQQPYWGSSHDRALCLVLPISESD